MKLFAPKYYENFRCIADKCNHSCCIGWEIDIDEAALNKYASLSHPYSKVINKTINYENAPHFGLNEHNHCPHLNEKGLCNIILNCGEEFICDICREHPRYYNFTNYGKEVGVGMSCEAACELILNSDNFDEIIEIDEIDGEIIKCEYDALLDRDTIFKILKDENFEIDCKVDMIYDYFDVYLHEFPFEKILSKLEYLTQDHKVLLCSAKNIYWNNDISKELERILAYFVYRHCSESCYFNEFLTSLSFSIFCTGLISTLADKNTILDTARIVSEEIEYSTENTETIKSLFY